MTIREAQKLVDNWINTFGVRYFNELTNMALLMEETGELARLIARKYGEQSFKKQEDAEHVEEKIADEMADVFFVLVCLANQMNIDLSNPIHKNLEKKTNKDLNIQSVMNKNSYSLSFIGDKVNDLIVEYNKLVEKNANPNVKYNTMRVE
ncbi:MAG TPA: nucleotide pyrophosphohydrolase, partial [Saprospiraceae bacterium]|nr:nucleotide pyrophosphohydrolase [Saprospiraceae bacterium]